MKKLIVIAGPTASGKTDLAIEVAQYFQTKIISADSRQCYIELNIGVAKPSEKDLQKIPHYFINSHSIHDEVSAGIYERYALQKLNEIFDDNDIAVCVGGTGMYIKALCEGIDEMPEVKNDLYLEIENKYLTNGLPWLKEEVKKVDIDFFMNGESENPSRLLRALSFKLTTGTSILNYRKNEIKPRNFQIIKYSIDIAREVLYNRINKRVEQMIEDGLVEEANNLLSNKYLNSLNTVGYKELFLFFEGLNSFDYSIDKIKQHTRNYAKRQITWFKNQGDYRWLKPNEILESITTIRI